MKEEYDLGVIIHEERFTYEDKGLEKVQDLGEFWEEKTGLPIPLGAIAIRRDIDDSIKTDFDLNLRKSLDMAYSNPKIPHEYILHHSQDKNLEVVQSHIDLYVNSFTKDIGEEGKKAVTKLFEEAQRMGLVGRANGNPVKRNLFHSFEQ